MGKSFRSLIISFYIIYLRKKCNHCLSKMTRNTNYRHKESDTVLHEDKGKRYFIINFKVMHRKGVLCQNISVRIFLHSSSLLPVLVVNETR